MQTQQQQIPHRLRALLVRASLPASKFPGKRKMHLDSTLATEVIRSLIVLQDKHVSPSTSSSKQNSFSSSHYIHPEFRRCFLEIAKRDPSLVGGALQRTLLDPMNPSHAPRLFFLVECLGGPQMLSEEVSWSGIVRQAELALQAGKWMPSDLRRILRGISMAGVYPASLASSAERYVAEKLAFADNNELGTYASILTSLPETRNSSLLRTLSDRATAAVGSPTMSLAALGSVCKSFLRAHYYDQKFVSKIATSMPNIVNQQQAKGQTLPFSTAVSVFTLWSLAGFSMDGKIRTVDDEIAERDREAKMEKQQNQNQNETSTGSSSSSPPPEAFVTLTRLLVQELPENEDLDLLILLMRGLQALRLRHWTTSAEVAKELDELLTCVSIQCQGFLLELKDEAAISIDDLSNLLPKYFVCLKRRPHRLTPNPVLEEGVEAFCKHINDRVEELIGNTASPPFFIVPHLLDHGSPCCKQTVIKILEEARVQDAPLPTLQTMRFLLECADTQTFTAPIARYLRKNFTFSTTDGIPLVQLTTAMMCFATAERLFPTPKEDEEAFEEKNLFIDDTLTSLEKQVNIRWDLRCIMKLVASLDTIGCTHDEQRGRMTLLFSKKMAPLVENADPNRYSKQDATLCLSAFANQLSVVPENVQKFLSTVSSREVSENDKNDENVTPTKWMQLNDPANTILERTLEQQKVDAILARLRLVPIEDTQGIQSLVKEYMKLFKHIHPDEVRFLFEIFSDRSIKDDRLLKDVMTIFIRSDSIKKVTVFTIAAIMNSCAQIRFAYIPLVKTMLATITEEQWSLIDAIELELLLVAMQRLSIRVASILMTLGEKTLQLAPALTASQASSLIAAYQQLGFHEDLVLSALVKRVAECADNMSAVTLSVLLAGPHAHRLPFNSETAAPVVRRLSEMASEIAPHQRQRIATNFLKKSTHLPADLLAGASGKLAQLTDGGGTKGTSGFPAEGKGSGKMRQLEW